MKTDHTYPLQKKPNQHVSLIYTAKNIRVDHSREQRRYKWQTTDLLYTVFLVQQIDGKISIRPYGDLYTCI